MRYHEIVVHIVLVVLGILFVLLVVGTVQRFTWLLFLPFLVRINFVIEVFLGRERGKKYFSRLLNVEWQIKEEEKNWYEVCIIEVTENNLIGMRLKARISLFIEHFFSAADIKWRPSSWKHLLSTINFFFFFFFLFYFSQLLWERERNFLCLLN